jgi:hypothetical protein
MPSPCASMACMVVQLNGLIISCWGYAGAYKGNVYVVNASTCPASTATPYGPWH